MNDHLYDTAPIPLNQDYLTKLYPPDAEGDYITYSEHNRFLRLYSTREQVEKYYEKESRPSYDTFLHHDMAHEQYLAFVWGDARTTHDSLDLSSDNHLIIPQADIAGRGIEDEPIYDIGYDHRHFWLLPFYKDIREILFGLMTGKPTYSERKVLILPPYYIDATIRCGAEENHTLKDNWDWFDDDIMNKDKD